MNKGYIYCLTNPTTEGLIKIGFTTKHPITRAKEISAATGVVYPYTVAYSRLVDNPALLEEQVHAHLRRYQVNTSREFFAINLTEAIQTIEKYANILEAKKRNPYPWAELFATFPDDGSPRELTSEEQEKCTRLSRKLKNNL